MNDKVIVGEVISAHGLQGHFKVKSFMVNPDDLFLYAQLSIEEKYDEISFKKIQSLKEYFIVSCPKIDSRNKVDEILSKKISIKRIHLPKNDESYYYTDLIGLSVVSNENPIGIVINVENFGSSDLLELKNLSDDKKYYLPFNNQTLEKIDFKNQLIYLKNVMGYLE